MTDYTQPESWMYQTIPPVHPADIFFIPGSTAFRKTQENGIADISPNLIANTLNLYGEQIAGLADLANIYTPYYRQLSLEHAIELTKNTPPEAIHRVYRSDVISKEPRTDIFAALDRYFSVLNTDRPFILAGHSQGSVLVQQVVEEYMAQHPDIYRRMIAAYSVGYGVSKSWVEAHPHIRYSQCAYDTGVLISWNAEGADPAGNNLLLSPDPLVTNPLSWTADETPVPASANHGSLLMSATGRIMKNPDNSLVLLPGRFDATVDLTRGSVICTDDTFEFKPNIFFGTKSLHIRDYALYYGNFRDNIVTRINAFLDKYPEYGRAPQI